MTYGQWITEVVKVLETVGTGIMVIGGLGAFLTFLRDAATDARRAGSYERLRRDLGRCIRYWARTSPGERGLVICEVYSGWRLCQPLWGHSGDTDLLD